MRTLLKQSLPHEVKELMGGESDDDFLNNAYWGDGSRIDVKILDALDEIYTRTLVAIPWQKAT